VQLYLADKGYRDMVVYCMDRNCRNDVGGWPTHGSEAPRDSRGFEYFATKDQAMADATDYGLMLWDGESKGTLNNVLKLSQLGNSVVVHFAPRSVSHTVRSSSDLSALLTNCQESAVHRLELELGIDRLSPRLATP
jgi:hypothetical protein